MIAFHLGEAHVSVTIARSPGFSELSPPGLSLLLEREREKDGEPLEPLIRSKQSSAPPSRRGAGEESFGGLPSVRPSSSRLYIIASFHI